MDSSSAQHHQEMSSQTLESMLACTKAQQEKKPRPPEQALKCPRCDSTNTKFCYYNNYSLTQPRYFCKSCRRYWTKGGTLRNVPVGGGCRKNKRSSSSSSSSKRAQDGQNPLITPNHTPSFSPLSYDSTDLSLAFARLQHQTGGGHLGFDEFSVFSANPNNNNNSNNNSSTEFDLMGNLGSHGHGFLDAIKSGFVESPNTGFQNLYYGDQNNLGNFGENGNVGLNGNGEMGIGSLTTTVKQEGWNINGGSRDQGENRVLWGFPWQSIGGGEHGNYMGGGGGGSDVVDSGRQSWNGINSSNWHGLLNSPLM